MREVVLREEYPDGGTRETLACGHVLYLTRRAKPSAERRCLLCLRKPHRNRKATR